MDGIDAGPVLWGPTLCATRRRGRSSSEDRWVIWTRPIHKPLLFILSLMQLRDWIPPQRPHTRVRESERESRIISIHLLLHYSRWSGGGGDAELFGPACSRRKCARAARLRVLILRWEKERGGAWWPCAGDDPTLGNGVADANNVANIVIRSASPIPPFSLCYFSFPRVLLFLYGCIICFPCDGREKGSREYWLMKSGAWLDMGSSLDIMSRVCCMLKLGYDDKNSTLSLH